MSARNHIGWSSALTGLFLLGAAFSPSSGERAALRVGVFDSRALVVAYAASDLFQERLELLREERERCRAAGDEQAARRIEARARERQARLHRQCFSTAPVDDLLELIEDAIPGIAERAGVDLIVSKWRLAYRHPEADLVDVTELMVEPFRPNPRTLRTIRHLGEHDPLPLYATDRVAVAEH